ncbi:MAG: OadG family protein [Anaerolineales bacterium]|jgi:Na+-transporting methylmalonyl-CoA/oxaloacetate decarboxylase gamma subunit
MSALTTSLWITLIGMSLVFGAIILLWGLMSLMTRILAERETSLKVQNESREKKARVAAAAVAVALAEQAQNRIGHFPMPNTALISAWQLGMRTRQMYQKGNRKL